MLEALFAGLGGLALGFVLGVVAGGRRAAGAAAPALPGPAPAGPPALPGPAGAAGAGGAGGAADLRAVRAGGRLRLIALGDEAEDVVLDVLRYDRFVLGRVEWHVLEGLYRERTVAVEWRDVRGERQVLLHLRPGRTLADVGLDPAALEGREVGAVVQAGGASWELEAQGKALRHEGGAGFGREHRAWVLADPGRRQLLRVARWGDDPPRASIAERVDPEAVEVLRTAAAG